MSFRIIDIHPHIISSDLDRYPISPLGGKRSTWSADHPADLDTLISNMDAANVVKAAIVQSSTTYGYNNDYVADAIAQYPERFTGVFTIDIWAPDAAEKIEQMHAMGFAGMRVFTRGTTMDQQWLAIDDPKTYPAWAKCQELGLPVATNEVLDDVGRPQLSNILRRFPSLRILLDHLSLPPIEDGYPYEKAHALWEMSEFPNLYLKACSKNFRLAKVGRSTPADFMSKIFEVYGPKRVAWGSNFPAEEESLPDLVEMCTSSVAELSEADRSWLFEKTALSLYPCLGAELPR
ncbi:amidohydrolase family protein [Novosphingobium mathurense]|uniref:Predicted metal-dependent hydrolase, TIM-barrel fold n=1 Tax=Novosphingobium mathurense TaxID=428990 RepID=A0A1U6ILW0_9SPHN|nr:amidohydrolase family protein [Novosphingobium mathurense]SLK09000.1 Predicted metal-dependent hydrolase, TIM-barrel fold [Novosphingobium mathurense]